MATGFQDTSRIVHDLVQKSKLISKGPPARYRLLTARKNLDNDGSVEKWTFGERDNNMQNKILLLVGETGTGKTTLINVMVNYILGVKFTDEVWFEITQEGGENPVSDQTKSQTTKIIVYEVFAQNNTTCLTIIDTPGYGDTRGSEYDRKIADNLYTLFHTNSGAKEIDAVCLVVKASQNRLSDRQQYIFDAILSLFGKDIENNIFICISHSDGMPPDNALNAIGEAAIPCRKDEQNEIVHYIFNNRQTYKRSKMYNRALQEAWELTYVSLMHLFASLKEGNRKSLGQTERVLTESKQLESCIMNLQNRIQFVDYKGKELAQIKKNLGENQKKIGRNENFELTVTKYYKEKVPIENVSWKDRNVTSCSVCEENCHEYGCWCAPKAKMCEVIKHGYCTSCSGKCHYTKHVKENKKYVILSKEIVMTYDELKKQFECSNYKASDIKFDSQAVEKVKKEIDSNKKQEEEINIEKRVNEDLIKTRKEKVKLVEEAYTSIIRLSEIALKPDSAFIVQAIDFLIPQVEEIKKNIFARKLRELRNIKPESQERVNAVMEYAGPGFNQQKK
ncbi:uncharacterized protein LOC128528706 [Clarias gariepinus]|uniref:uncharacterized protein LOC128528706 n=1 Tax=Clarias gariepinus TaxID=13013 RepID=UPI00234C58B2|nr:uncharacterized protein LOC128528706 [Clarias gariepinus]